MATGSVSALDQDTWQLIATNTTTSGSTSTFSSLSGYKEYLITWNGVSTSSNGSSYLQFNSDTGTNYFGGISLGEYDGTFQNKSDRIILNYSTIRTTLSGYISIKNVNNGAPKIVAGTTSGQSENQWQVDIDGGWLTTDTITSIVITAGAGTFSAGTMKLYGIAG